MIIVKLMGGLGNQLFQYSFGRHISLINDVELKLDATSGFINDFYSRNYLLDNFRINAKIASQEELQKFIKYSLSKRDIGKKDKLTNIREIIRNNALSSLLLRVKGIYYGQHKIIQETKFKYDPTLLSTKYDDAYFQGYWQSEQYFLRISSIIREELKTNHEIPENIRPLEDEISRHNSIGIHLRRYQYVKGKGVDKAAIRIYAELSSNYYSKAIELLEKHLFALKLYVFSDDIEWAKNIIRSKRPLSFVQTGLELADFELLRNCKHQIIANSTFSWWAAWLNDNKYKIVVAPRRWFKRTNSNIASLYPNSWKIV